MTSRIELIPVLGLPLVQAGDNLASLIIGHAIAQGTPLQGGDVVVVAQKVVSKAEGAVVDLSTVVPGLPAGMLSRNTGRDVRLCEIILREGAVLKTKGPVIVTKHRRLGMILTNAGVDRSNVGGGEVVCLLPQDPDASARELRAEVLAATGQQVAVIISDSFGRPDRLGSVGTAIGISGIAAVESAGARDLFGKGMSPHIAKIDEFAAAASLLMGQGSEGVPVVLVRGAKYTASEDATINEVLIREEIT